MHANEKSNEPVRVTDAEETGEDAFILAKLKGLQGRCAELSNKDLGKELSMRLQ